MITDADLQRTDRITAKTASELMAYAGQADGRIQITEANADIWEHALAGGTFGVALQVILDYYRKYDPKAPDQKPITPGYIRHAAIERRRYQERRHAALEPPPPRKTSRMPAESSKGSKPTASSPTETPASTPNPPTEAGLLISRRTMSKQIAYEVTIAGTVYRCLGVRMTSEYLIRDLGNTEPPNMMRLQEVHQIGTQRVTCDEVKLPLIDHMIRPVWESSDD